MAKKRARVKQGNQKKIIVTLSVIVLLAVFTLAKLVYTGQVTSLNDLLQVMGINPGYATSLENPALVHMIDVGQGDSTLIQIEDYNILIDAGENHMGATVCAYLKNLGVTKIDLLVGTHPHSDHIGGADMVIDQFQVDTLLLPDLAPHMVPNTKTYLSLLQSAADRGVTIKTATLYDTYYFGAGVFTVYGPQREYDDLNNDSIVMQLIYGGRTFLFMGDAERKVEKDLLDGEVPLEADVLRVGHHGTKNGSSQSFLTKVAPDYSVISVGLNNEYGHPHKEAIERLVDCGSKILTTSELGNIVFETDGKTLTYKTAA